MMAALTIMLKSYPVSPFLFLFLFSAAHRQGKEARQLFSM